MSDPLHRRIARAAGDREEARDRVLGDPRLQPLLDTRSNFEGHQGVVRVLENLDCGGLDRAHRKPQPQHQSLLSTLGARRELTLPFEGAFKASADVVVRKCPG